MLLMVLGAAVGISQWGPSKVEQAGVPGIASAHKGLGFAVLSAVVLQVGAYLCTHALTWAGMLT